MKRIARSSGGDEELERERRERERGVIETDERP